MTTFTGTSGKDHFIGGNGNDVFVFDALNLSDSDVLQGGGGLNVLELVNTSSQSWQDLKTTQWLGLSRVSAVALVSYGFGFDLSFDNNLYNANKIKLLTIDAHALNDVTQGLHVHAGNVTNMAFRILGSAGGWDNIKTGAGSDIFAYTADSLNVRDSIDGGKGVDTLLLVGAGEIIPVKDGPDYVSPVGHTYLGDVKNIDNIVITGLDKNYTREIGFGNLAGTSTYVGTGVLTISTNKNYGTNQASSSVDGTIVVDGSRLTTKQILHVTGGTAADKLTGGSANDKLAGSAGDDQLTGGAGNDQLAGGIGNDTLAGGLGSDTMTGDAGDDAFNIAGSRAGQATEFYQDKINGGLGKDTLYFTSQLGIQLSAAGLGSNAITGIEAIKFYSDHSSIELSQTLLAQNHDANGRLQILEEFIPQGSDGSGLKVDASKVADKSLFIDVEITLPSHKEILKGGAGNDVFNFSNGFFSQGNSGLDFFDQIVGGAGIDTVFVREGHSADLGTGVLSIERLTVVADATVSGTATEINVAVTNALTIDGSALAANEPLTVHGNAWDRVNHPYDGVPIDATGNLTVIGGQGNDTLVGGLGSDRITGGDGNDIIFGRAGGDVLTGGAGADDFVYSDANDSTSVPAKRDTITDFSHVQDDLIYFLHNSTAPFTFIGGATFSNIAGQVRSYNDGSATYVELDLNGDKQADFQILVQGVPTLQASDFSL